MASKRLTVNLSEKAYKELETMAKERGITMTEVLRRAIGMEKFMSEAMARNNKILLEDSDGKIERVVIPWA